MSPSTTRQGFAGPSGGTSQTTFHAAQRVRARNPASRDHIRRLPVVRQTLYVSGGGRADGTRLHRGLPLRSAARAQASSRGDGLSRWTARRCPPSSSKGTCCRLPVSERKPLPFPSAVAGVRAAHAIDAGLGQATSVGETNDASLRQDGETFGLTIRGLHRRAGRWRCRRFQAGWPTSGFPTWFRRPRWRC